MKFKDTIRKHIKLTISLLLILLILISSVFWIPKTVPYIIYKTTSWQKNQVVSIISGVDFANEVITDDVSVGSGFVFEILPTKSQHHPHGGALVMTAAHNINSENFLLIEANNAIRIAELVYSDPSTDIAILLVPEIADWNKAYKIVPSDTLKIGDDISCICSPKTAYLNNTKLEGKITNLKVNGISNQYLTMTDLPLSPGCSGSPIFNKRGQVVGMNAFKSTEFGTEGMSFAITSEKLLKAIENYKNGVAPPDYGIELTPSITAQYRNPAPGGLGGMLTVKSVSDTSVFKGQLEPGDKIQNVGKSIVYTIADFYENLTPGATILLYRGDKTIQLKYNGNSVDTL